MTKAIEMKFENLVNETLPHLANVEADQNFVEAGLVDSIEYLDLVMIVEDHFQIDLEDADITDDNFGSKGQILAFIKRKTIKSNSCAPGLNK